MFDQWLVTSLRIPFLHEVNGYWTYFPEDKKALIIKDGQDHVFSRAIFDFQQNWLLDLYGFWNTSRLEETSNSRLTHAIINVFLSGL